MRMLYQSLRDSLARTEDQRLCIVALRDSSPGGSQMENEEVNVSDFLHLCRPAGLPYVSSTYYKLSRTLNCLVESHRRKIKEQCRTRLFRSYTIRSTLAQNSKLRAAFICLLSEFLGCCPDHIFLHHQSDFG